MIWDQQGCDGEDYIVCTAKATGSSWTNKNVKLLT